MFKNILKFLFEEEEENLVDEPLEDIGLSSSALEKKEPKEPKKPIKQEPAVKVSEEPISTKHTAKQPQLIKKPVREEINAKPKKRFIDFDEPQHSYHSASQVSRVDSKRDFELSPVISPIFGTKEDLQVREAMDHETTVVRVKKKNPLGTIISPMYGATELEEMEDQAQVKLAKKAAQKQRVKDSNDESAKEPPVFENVENMPLEDLLANEGDDDNDDVMQFSLFGGEEVVKADNEKSIFAIDEEE